MSSEALSTMASEVGAQEGPYPRFDLPAPDVDDVTAIAALLADRTRAGILALLRDGPHCVCEFAATFGERENNVSNHLAKLRQAGLARASRHGADARWRYYERDEDAIARATEALDRILKCTRIGEALDGASIAVMPRDASDLSRAWSDAAASLPPGWELGGLRCASTGLTPEDRSEEWIAEATGPGGRTGKRQAADPIAALDGLTSLVRSISLEGAE